jgi:ankyrin repeat protein
VKLSFCSSCRSVSYCSRACQKADWKTHKNICKKLNVGDAKQIALSNHQARTEKNKKLAELALSDCSPRVRRFFDLFFETQGDTDHTATVRNMKKILLKESRSNRRAILFRSLAILSQHPSEMLKLPTSPVKIALQFVDANVMSADDDDDGRGFTPLHCLAQMSDPSKEHTLVNQCILAKQLIEEGANVNARAQRNLGKRTPLHSACSGSTCTNLDFIQSLLDHGANPNAKDIDGNTPLHYTKGNAPGAAKFLLTYSDKTDPGILTNDGRSFLVMVRSSIAECKSKASTPHNPHLESIFFLVKQWEEVEKLLVERVALDSGRG